MAKYDEHIVKEEVIDGKQYVFYDDGVCEIYETDDEGNNKYWVVGDNGNCTYYRILDKEGTTTEEYYDLDGTCYQKRITDYDGNSELFGRDGKLIQTTTVDGNGGFEIKNPEGVLISKRKVYSEEHYLLEYYYEDGTIESTTEIDGDNFFSRDYDKHGNITFENSNKTRSYFSYDENNKLVKSVVYDNEANMKTTKKYSDVYMYEERIQNDRLQYTRRYHGDDIEFERLYEYNSNGTVKSVSEKKIYHDLHNEAIYTYDANGKLQLSNNFYKDGELVLHLEESVKAVSYLDDRKVYVFFSNNGEFLTINEKGERTYTYNDYYLEYSYRMFLREDGTYTVSVMNEEGEYTRGHRGTYLIDDNGHVICTDEKNNQYEYNTQGELIKKIEDGVTYEYDPKKGSEIKTKNGKTTYSLKNHIEYDEETYETLMKGLISIGEEYPQKINSDYENCENIVNDFEDSYSIGTLSEANTTIQNSITTITEMEESINYSLLAYSTCDKHLEELTHSLIDSLFDKSETALANVFKRDINEHIEDRDNDKIFEYKENTNFNNLFEDVLPLDKEEDLDGNIWYYNLKGELISVTGENPKITYGDVEFKVEVTDSGIIKLTDPDGKPLDIFADYNIDSGQFGGDQTAFDYSGSILSDEKNLKVLEKFFDDGITEDKIAYLQKVAATGCGYTAMTNIVFKEFEGREEDFYNTFGYPMYTIRKRNDRKVDYNFEPMILELYSEVNNRDNAFVTTHLNGDGVTDKEYRNMYAYLQNEYGIFEKEYDDYIPNTGLFGDFGYSLYEMDGTLYCEYGGPHAMIKLGELEDGRWIVTTWGKKMIYEPCKYDEEYYDGEDGDID